LLASLLQAFLGREVGVQRLRERFAGRISRIARTVPTERRGKLNFS